jgi:hypothetical protein
LVAATSSSGAQRRGALAALRPRVGAGVEEQRYARQVFHLDRQDQGRVVRPVARLQRRACSQERAQAVDRAVAHGDMQQRAFVGCHNVDPRAVVHEAFACICAAVCDGVAERRQALLERLVEVRAAHGPSCTSALMAMPRALPIQAME